MKTLINKWNRLPTWGKVTTIALLLNEVRGAFVAYYMIDNGAFSGNLPIGEMIWLGALVVVPAIAHKIWKRRRKSA